MSKSFGYILTPKLSCLTHNLVIISESGTSEKVMVCWDSNLCQYRYKLIYQHFLCIAFAVIVDQFSTIIATPLSP